VQTKLAYSRAWHLIDVGADQRSLGRIASRIAIVLMGKHKPIWDPSSLWLLLAPLPLLPLSLSLRCRYKSKVWPTKANKRFPTHFPADCGDYVVAVGCNDLHTTGKKRFQKKYYRHTTRPGSLQEITMDRMFAKWGGAEVLRRAVSGMLPKNRLRDKRLARLKGSFPTTFYSPPPPQWVWVFFFVAPLLLTGKIAAFEGAEHPYKANLIRYHESSMIGRIPEVRDAFKESRSGDVAA
jgi:large subunit ribosomal protein L13